MPEMTASFLLPCSSRAIRSASSMSSVPIPWCWNRVGLRECNGTAVPYTVKESGQLRGPGPIRASLLTVQLADHARLSVFEQFGAERALGSEFAQPEQTDEDIPVGVFVREECLPSSVGGVIPSDELELVRLCRTRTGQPRVASAAGGELDSVR